MSIKNTLSISEARKKIFDIAKQVQKPGQYFTLTEKGHPKVVIMSAEEHESMTETMEVLRDCPDIFERIAESEQAIKTGDWSNFITLEELGKKWGLAIAEKPKKKYAVSNTNRKTSRKTAR